MRKKHRKMHSQGHVVVDSKNNDLSESRADANVGQNLWVVQGYLLGNWKIFVRGLNG